MGIHNKKRRFNFAVSYSVKCLFLIFFLITVSAHPNSFAQDKSNKEKPDHEGSRQVILQKQRELKKEIEKINTALELRSKDERDIPASHLEQKLEILKKIDLIYEQQLVQLTRSRDLTQTHKELREELSAFTDQLQLPQPPYSFSHLDELKEKLILFEGHGEAITATINDAQASLRAAEDKLSEAERNLRRVKEGLGKEKDIAELDERLANEEVALRKRALENENLEQAIYQSRRELIRKKISFLTPRVQFSKKELQNQIFKIEKDIIKLKKSLEKAKTKEELAHARWISAKKQLDSEVLPNNKIETREKEAENWKIWNDTRHLETEILSQCLKHLDETKEVWQSRYALFHEMESVDLASWKKEVAQNMEQLEREERLLTVRQTECLNEILTLEGRLASTEVKSLPAWAIEEQLEALKTQEGLFKRGLESIRSTQREYQKLKSEIERREEHKSIEERLSNLLTVARRVWHYEIISIEDHPVTVGKIIVGLILLVIGFLFSHYFTSQVGKQLIRRFGLDESAAFACQRILHYLLLLLIVLFVLYLVRIPLTFFTVVGGALAIGVGFGSQNIVNNFLSGLVLMVERPIKIGDIVEVENVRGTVELVGTRSTRIKTFDNLHLVVPNSTLLQNKVINWRLSDDIVRRAITVGVQYGSPVRTVEKLLQQAVREHVLVEKYPSPIVLFDDFGDNALIFTVLIWVKMSKMGKTHLYIREIESDIRFRIDELFRDNKIVIAFPQRDVHLDTLKPLEVKVQLPEE